MTSDPSDPTPERPGMSSGADDTGVHGRNEDDEQSGAPQGGQVSEAEGATLHADGVGTPITDTDAVAGYPDSESGGPDEGPSGPDANPNAGARHT